MNLALTLHFVRQDLMDKHAATALGALWTLLLPLANILIFTLVFSKIMGARLHSLGLNYLDDYSYSVYLIPALLAWNTFSATFTRITAVFHTKARLITKVRIPLLSLPLYIVISESVIYGISMLFYAAFLIMIDFQWTIHWLWLPLIYAIQQLFAYSLGLLFAIFSVFFRDIRTFTTILVQLWFWLTPIVYVITILPEKYAGMFQLNPIYHLVQAYRDALVMGKWPDVYHLALVALTALCILAIAIFTGSKLEKDIRDFL